MSKGFTIIGTLAALTILVIAAGCLQQPQTKPGADTPDNGRARAIDSFVTCADAGYPVMESYPRQCRTPEGQTFVEELPEDGQPLPPADGEGKEGAFCGSETGIPCALGFDCQLRGNYPDARGKCVEAEVRPPILAREGERCGGFDSRSCDIGLVCNWTDGPPGSSDMGSGSCVRVAETAPPLPRGKATAAS